MVDTKGDTRRLSVSKTFRAPTLVFSRFVTNYLVIQLAMQITASAFQCFRDRCPFDNPKITDQLEKNTAQDPGRQPLQQLQQSKVYSCSFVTITNNIVYIQPDRQRHGFSRHKPFQVQPQYCSCICCRCCAATRIFNQIKTTVLITYNENIQIFSDMIWQNSGKDLFFSCTWQVEQ